MNSYNSPTYARPQQHNGPQSADECMAKRLHNTTLNSMLSRNAWHGEKPVPSSDGLETQLLRHMQMPTDHQLSEHGGIFRGMPLERYTKPLSPLQRSRQACRHWRQTIYDDWSRHDGKPWQNDVRD